MNEEPNDARSNGEAGRDGGQAPSDIETVPGLDAGRSQETARALRDRLEPDERERVERTVARLLDLLGKAHAMAILSTFAFADGPLRFSEIEERLEVPANTLTERLKELVAAGLLRREAYDEVPPRVEYEPTEKGRAAFPAFGHLHAWAIEHDLEPVEE
ncbi:helix-turn-helix domain-containing protein [Natrinema sp. 1APR25-10V2]|uniref:winged helix-turn-helix transcriptional regulator n=1 Tax=Natrinema sp. 1APR25-10V2 TaxID=2951081 RepID=UPI002875139B|nr:helix-turn-helix domain-containing protein [Natrinema sp. 1APR25-10V2]MDS0477340.1 helix-turn-helix transcriptional regulator [Natrinema sp. 1APR25-10V2]